MPEEPKVAHEEGETIDTDPKHAQETTRNLIYLRRENTEDKTNSPSKKSTAEKTTKSGPIQPSEKENHVNRIVEGSSWHTLAECPEKVFKETIDLDEISFPRFLTENWTESRYLKLIDTFKENYIVFLDDAGEKVLAAGFAAPVHLSDGLPENGWEGAVSQAISDNYEGIEPNALVGLSAYVSPDAQGQGLGGKVLSAFVQRANELGISKLIVPARPTNKSKYTDLSMEEYINLHDESGKHVDPWIRIHEDHGGKVVGVGKDTHVVRALDGNWPSVNQWQEWTGMEFANDGEYSIPNGNAKLKIQNGVGEYREDCAWIEYDVSKAVPDELQAIPNGEQNEANQVAKAPEKSTRGLIRERAEERKKPKTSESSVNPTNPDISTETIYQKVEKVAENLTQKPNYKLDIELGNRGIAENSDYHERMKRQIDGLWEILSTSLALDPKQFPAKKVTLWIQQKEDLAKGISSKFKNKIYHARKKYVGLSGDTRGVTQPAFFGINKYKIDIRTDVQGNINLPDAMHELTHAALGRLHIEPAKGSEDFVAEALAELGRSFLHSYLDPSFKSEVRPNFDQAIQIAKGVAPEPYTLVNMSGYGDATMLLQRYLFEERGGMEAITKLNSYHLKTDQDIRDAYLNVYGKPMHELYEDAQKYYSLNS